MQNNGNDILEIANGKKLAKWFKQYIIFIAVTIISLVYVFKGLTEVIGTGKTWQDIILDGSLSYIVAMSITALLSRAGLLAGKQDILYVNTNLQYGKLIELDVTPNIEYLDIFCEEDNEELLIRNQKQMLATVGLSYNKFRNNQYVLNTLTPAQIKVLNEVSKLKVRPITTNMLLSETDFKKDDNDFGRLDKQYELGTNTKNGVSKIIFALLFGYYSLRFIENGINWGGIIYYSIQVAMFLFSGVIEYFNSKNFIINEKRNGIIKKMNKLYTFINKVKKSPTYYKEKLEQREKELRELKEDIPTTPNTINLIESEVKV
jgi:hypothetical protein